MLLTAISAGAQSLPQTFNTKDLPRYTHETGYGFDFTDSPSKGSKKPYYFSIDLPDGNYKVTVKLGSKKQAAVTTVRAESRRLFVENLATKKGQFVEESFIVNKRNPKISDKESVKIKEREKSKLNWDNKLTLEFNGDSPACESITIEPADESVVTVFLCGNSTVVDQDTEPWASWGQMIPRFFNEKVAFANYAESGESANTFIGAKRLAKAMTMMKPGDYFFIEFGHNDQKQKGAGKGAYFSFATSIKTFIDEVRSRGGHPILVTPTSRRSFDKNNKIINTHGEYLDAVKWVAEKENVPIIDLNSMTATLYETLGVEESKCALVHYPKGTFPGQDRDLADNTHFNTYGAYQIAKCVIEGAKTSAPELIKNLRFDPKYCPSKPDEAANFKWNLSPFFEADKPDGN